MAVSNYHWVCTDRRTDAEILKEIAQVDTPRMILQRKPLRSFEKEFISKDGPAGMIFLWGVTTEGSRLSVTNRWPSALSLLVTPPAEFDFLADFGSRAARTSAARRVNSLWDWLILRQSEGETIQRIQMEMKPVVPDPSSVDSSPSELVPTDTLTEVASRFQMSDLIRRQLVPQSGHTLSEICRNRITDLAGIEFPSDTPDVTALRAGLFQWHDALDESHACSQAIEGQGRHRAGDYWHAIMHRREPDYGNSKYWFRHVGRHPIFPELGRRAEPLIAAVAPEWKDRLLKNGWDTFAFVDFCEAVADGQPAEWVTLAETIQELEMLLLLDSTYRDATKIE